MWFRACTTRIDFRYFQYFQWNRLHIKCSEVDGITQYIKSSFLLIQWFNHRRLSVSRAHGKCKQTPKINKSFVLPCYIIRQAREKCYIQKDVSSTTREQFPSNNFVIIPNGIKRHLHLIKMYIWIFFLLTTGLFIANRTWSVEIFYDGIRLPENDAIRGKLLGTTWIWIELSWFKGRYTFVNMQFAICRCKVWHVAQIDIRFSNSLLIYL